MLSKDGTLLLNSSGLKLKLTLIELSHFFNGLYFAFLRSQYLYYFYSHANNLKLRE